MKQGIIRKGVGHSRPKHAKQMAFKDTWHRALVYFGLAEDHDYGPEYEEDFDPETGTEEVFEGREGRRERGESSSSVRRLPTSRRPRRDEIDDIFADDEPMGGGRTRTLRPVDNGGNGADVQVHLVIPRNFNDAQQVADQFKRSVPVILNLQTADHELSKRMIDFCSGLTYALDGGMQRIAEKMFLLTPRNVEVSAEEKARLIDKGFFNQS
jgi:cell division inhibitor SepF